MCRTVLALALVVASAASSAHAELTASTLDGSTYTGELVSWSAEQVVVATADGEVPLKTEQLISLRWSNSGAAAATGGAAAELVDGSILPLNEISVVEGRAVLTLRSAASEGDVKLSVPVRRIAAAWLRPLTGSLVAQWEEIRDLGTPSDVLVVRRREGESLDYVAGIIRNIAPDRIEFRLDDRTVRIDRANVAGVIYYRAGSDDEAEPLCTVHGRDGLRVEARRAELADGRLRLVTLSGVELTWPLEDVHWTDFSAGKLAFLSDLEPATARWTPLVALPSSASLAAEYGRTRRDESAFGGPIMLWFPGDDDALGYEESFSKGLAIRSRTELAYRLPRGFGRLTALAGIEPATRASGHVALRIEADGRTLLDVEIAGDDPPLPIDLDVSGARRLTIVVDYGHNLDTGDWLNLANARLVK